MLKNLIANNSLNSGWELGGNKRKRFEYDGDNISVIYNEVLEGDTWKLVFKQELSYDVDGNLTVITGIKI